MKKIKISTKEETKNKLNELTHYQQMNNGEPLNSIIDYLVDGIAHYSNGFSVSDDIIGRFKDVFEFRIYIGKKYLTITYSTN